jgi:hypothetical protein
MVRKAVYVKQGDLPVSETPVFMLRAEEPGEAGRSQSGHRSVEAS